MRSLIVRNPTLDASVAPHSWLKCRKLRHKPLPKIARCPASSQKRRYFSRDGEVGHHVVRASLTFQHGHLETVQMPPACLQRAAVMPIARELVGIIAGTVGPTLSRWDEPGC